MERMKILVFEYITGGGFNESELPDTLAAEGLLMLQALLTDLGDIAAVEIVVMVDERLQPRLTPSRLTKVHAVGAGDDCWRTYRQLLAGCDAVWPVAPESNGLLAACCAEAERAGKILLNTTSDTVKIAGDKWLTYLQLCHHQIATVPTQQLDGFDYPGGEWMIKTKDGVGCEDSFIINSQAEWLTKTNGMAKSCHIVQPHLTGQKTSLSCLFKQGAGWLLSVNLQEFIVQDQQYRLKHIKVNNAEHKVSYLALVNQVANALPGLWGYVGIDLIETEGDELVLELNPRLTTSFAGLRSALGINCAALMLQLLDGAPVLEFPKNQTITLTINP